MTLIELEKLGEATLNNAPKLEDICRTINDCTCKFMWCEHDMRNLGALKEAYAEGRKAGLEDAAKVCDFHANDDECDNCSKEIAKAIRGLSLRSGDKI